MVAELLKHAKEDALFQTLIATAVDGIIVIDELGTVQIYNAACERLFGYAEEEVVGHNVKMLMPVSYRGAHDDYLEHYRKTGERRIIGIGREVTGERTDGSTFPMYLSVGEGTLGGKRIFVGIIHDLTTRDASRRRLSELRAELLHVSRLSDMAQMVAALAHELNQPLTAIMNYVKAARRAMAGVESPQKARVEGLIDKAAAQTARAGKIIRHLRDFIEKRESIRSEENINDVVREAIELGLVGTADQGVDLRVALMADSPTVIIDKVQIQQVVINLVRNSIEAMAGAKQRSLTVETRAGGPGLVEVVVSDTGPGLTREVAEKLFQPFVTTKEKGMGIGLTICQSIVEAHNGSIWAMPNAPSGAVFRFTLPVAG